MEINFQFSEKGFYPEKVETENMILRSASTEKYDSQKVLEAMETDGVTEAFKSYPYEVPDTEEKALNFIEKRNFPNKPGGNFAYLIELKESDNAFDGEIVIKTDERDAELGFWLTSDYWGNAYAPEAAKAVIKFLLDETKFEKVHVQVTENNQKAKKATEKFILPLGGEKLGERQTTLGEEAEYSDSDKQLTVLDYELEREDYSP